MSAELDYYRDLYDSEWNRRDEIRQALALPAGVLTLIAGVLVFYARTFSFPQSWSTYVFVFSLITAAASFVVAVYMLARAVFGPKYTRIPWPSEIRDHEEALLNYYRKRPGGIPAARDEWEAFLIDRYVAAGNRNAANNANSGEYLYKANRAVVITLISIAAGATPVIVDFRATGQQPYKVEITNLEQLIKEETQQGGGQQNTPAAPAQETKPVAPSNHEIRTGSQSPETKRGGGNDK
jgi:hypothetical protein